MGERVGDLVLRAQPPRELALRGERDLEPRPEELRLLVQPRVLDQHRKLRAERAHQRDLVLVERALALRVHGQEADDRLPREQRNGK